ncbi:MAG: hypothetical protein CSA95_06085 [Bacteroidetes bacterium]|nr:MAG: hypothetical protein CSA95_06085 [Bacteroidota bacterium]
MKESVFALLMTGKKEQRCVSLQGGFFSYLWRWWSVVLRGKKRKFVLESAFYMKKRQILEQTLVYFGNEDYFCGLMQVMVKPFIVLNKDRQLSPQERLSSLVRREGLVFPFFCIFARFVMDVNSIKYEPKIN